VRADRAFDARSMKAQLRAADRTGAAVAVIVGEDELSAGTAIVKAMRNGPGQQVVARGDVVRAVRALLGGRPERDEYEGEGTA
jgi:histidyl-tRNA synthetase